MVSVRKVQIHPDLARGDGLLKWSRGLKEQRSGYGDASTASCCLCQTCQ